MAGEPDIVGIALPRDELEAGEYLVQIRANEPGPLPLRRYRFALR